ncbi:MAG: hypothetical protein H6558_13450 [Lewinellaceae bacterium]|nr:hypothetical protein [Lewinellaceae bacterium]
MALLFQLKASGSGRVCGVEACLLKGREEPVFQLVELERVGDEARIVGRKMELGSWEELSNALPEGQPVALSITGAGILHRRVEGRSGEWHELVAQAMPNAKAAGLAGQVEPAGERPWLAVARRESLIPVLNLFRGRPVAALFIGGLNIGSVLPLLGEGEVRTGCYRLEVGEGQLVDISPFEGQETSLHHPGGEELDGRLMPAFAGALQLALGREVPVYNLPEMEELKTEYRQERLLWLGGWGALLALLLLLLANFLAFSWLSSRNQELEAALAFNRKQVEEVQELEKALQEKNSFLKGSNILSASRTSFYADEVGRIAPGGITLEELWIFPLQNPDVKRDKQDGFVFQDNLILARGLSRNSAILNLWIKQLESLDWVKEVKVLPYREDENGAGEFELHIIIY